jgi:hypothetical protein
MRFVALLIALPPALGPDVDSTALARKYSEAVREVNEAHARSPGDATEDQLAAKLPKAARQALEALLRAKPADDLVPALASAAEAAADLDLEADFERLRARLEAISAGDATELGSLESRELFVVRGLGGLDAEYVAHFADVVEVVLAGYDEVFGFDEWSKVPGKKLRFRVHLEARIESPPHFAPQFPFHSEIDFPVDDAQRLKSPTADGKFLFYGLAHELGHVIAMWGDREREEDHHAWAHYTGVTVVEHLARDPKRAKALEGLTDVRWRSLEKERESVKSVEPSLASRESVLALLIALHDDVGPRAIGDAIDRLDAEDDRLRINRVRYYTFGELKSALLETLEAPAAKRRVSELLE